MATQSTGAGTTDEFHASKEYLSLNAKQRVWLDVFIETQDAAQATQTAYNPATETYGKLLRYKIEANPRMRAAVNVALGRSEQEAFLVGVLEDIRRAPKGSDR